MTKVPFVIAGDFNIPFEQFCESGWCERLKVKPIHPNAKSTISSSADRVIDFGLISNDIYPMFVEASPIFDVTRGPHIAFIIRLLLKPRSITARVICVPKALPVNDFNKLWKQVSDEQQKITWSKSVKRARHILNKHKSKTGVAILGSAMPELNDDPKFQGDLKLKCIEAGEKAAEASLASELCVLDIVGIPRCEQKQYTGRCQYPRFKTKSLVKANTSKEYTNSSLMYWCQAKQCLTHTINLLPQLDNARREAVVLALAKFLDFSENHCCELDDILKAEAIVMSRVLRQQTADLYLPFVLSKFLNTIEQIQKIVINRNVNYLSKKWKIHVKDQLYSGGGKLFSFISRLDKQFLAVTWETHGNGATHPDEFLSKQRDAWGKFWSPEDPHLIHQVAQNYKDLRNAVLEQANFVKFDEDKLNKALKGYMKDTLGGDFWKPSELRFLPSPAKINISNACEFAINAVAMPHQLLISLNALLGKPGNGCRTVCKTPVLYRMILRVDESVRKWEIENAQAYDTAQVGSSALLAALKRNLKAEVAKWLGQEFAAIFNDYEKK